MNIHRPRAEHPDPAVGDTSPATTERKSKAKESRELKV